MVVYNVLTLLVNECCHRDQNNPELSDPLSSTHHTVRLSELLAGTQTVHYCTLLVVPNDPTSLTAAFSLLSELCRKSQKLGSHQTVTTIVPQHKEERCQTPLQDADSV